MSDEEITVQPAAISHTEYFGRWAVVLAPLFWIAGTVWVFHHVWHRFDPVIFIFIWLPTGGTKLFFNYLRQFRPDRVPPMPSEDSKELARLKRKKTLLKRAGWSGGGFCLVLGLAIRLFSGMHPGETCYLIPDVLWPWIALPLLPSCVSLIWGEVLEAQIKERTPRQHIVAGAQVGRSGRERRTPTVISGSAFQGNGFHSEHWGELGSKEQGLI